MASRAASSFSLFLALAACAWCTDYVKLRQELDGAKSLADVRRVAQSIDTSNDQELRRTVWAVTHYDYRTAVNHLRSVVTMRADVTQAIPDLGSRQKIAQQAKEIKSSSFYRDTGVGESPNWLARALQRLIDLLFRNRNQQSQVTTGQSEGNWSLVKPILIGILIALIALFTYFAARHFSWQRSQRRKANALLSEEEPMRTLDEWLVLADSLTQEGRFREAVRCLYLACLLRFDEANVARFERSQTNWEHLARIQNSPHRPQDLDFREPTQRFDRVWYGQMVEGVQDVERFRAWYSQITAALSGATP